MTVTPGTSRGFRDYVRMPGVPGESPRQEKPSQIKRLDGVRIGSPVCTLSLSDEERAILDPV
jgi:hypothetical protein